MHNPGTRTLRNYTQSGILLKFRLKSYARFCTVRRSFWSWLFNICVHCRTKSKYTNRYFTENASRKSQAINNLYRKCKRTAYIPNYLYGSNFLDCQQSEMNIRIRLSGLTPYIFYSKRLFRKLVSILTVNIQFLASGMFISLFAANKFKQ